MDFIKTQKANLRESEARLRELNDEHAKMKPVVDADKETIKAIFALQEERTQAKVWVDRFIGAFFGILSSLIATVLYKLVSTRKYTGPRITAIGP